MTPEKQEKIRTQARGMSIHELRHALDWGRSLVDHSCEIGDSRLNSVAATKIDIIEAEMRRRGERL